MKNLSLISQILLRASEYPPKIKQDIVRTQVLKRNYKARRVKTRNNLLSGSNMFRIVPLVCATFRFTRYENPSELWSLTHSESDVED